MTPLPDQTRVVILNDPSNPPLVATNVAPNLKVIVVDTIEDFERESQGEPFVFERDMPTFNPEPCCSDCGCRH